MTLRNNSHLRATLIAMRRGEPLPDEPEEVIDPDLPLPQAVLENYERYRSIKKVSRVLSRYYSRHIPEYSVSRILKDNGVEIKARNPSIYDSQL